MGVIPLPDEGSVYVDTAGIIYAVERHPKYAALLDPVWIAMRSGTIEIVTSEIAVMECLVGPLRAGNDQLVSHYETVLSGSEMRLIPVSAPVLRTAAELRASLGLRAIDAIHTATALGASCDLFITNDQHFRKVTNLPLVILDDL